MSESNHGVVLALPELPAESHHDVVLDLQESFEVVALEPLQKCLKPMAPELLIRNSKKLVGAGAPWKLDALRPDEAPRPKCMDDAYLKLIGELQSEMCGIWTIEDANVRSTFRQKVSILDKKIFFAPQQTAEVYGDPLANLINNTMRLKTALKDVMGRITDISWTVTASNRLLVNFGCDKTPGKMFVAFRLRVTAHENGFEVRKCHRFFNWMSEIKPDQICAVPLCSSTMLNLAVDTVRRTANHIGGSLAADMGLPPEICRTQTQALSEYTDAKQKEPPLMPPLVKRQTVVLAQHTTDDFKSPLVLNDFEGLPPPLNSSEALLPLLRRY